MQKPGLPRRLLPQGRREACCLAFVASSLTCLRRCRWPSNDARKGQRQMASTQAKWILLILIPGLFEVIPT
eukprot:4041288-Amphidinium_carterae.1